MKWASLPQFPHHFHPSNLHACVPLGHIPNMLHYFLLSHCPFFSPSLATHPFSSSLHDLSFSLQLDASCLHISGIVSLFIVTCNAGKNFFFTGHLFILLSLSLSLSVCVLLFPSKEGQCHGNRQFLFVAFPAAVAV